MMQGEIRAILAVTRKAYLMWQATRWERTACRLMKYGFAYEMQLALEKAERLTQMI